MRNSKASVLRGIRAEWMRTAGIGRLWTVLAPAAVVTPAAISVLIAVVAERFARIPGQVGILQVSTSNAAYWVISITTILMAAAAADGSSSESRFHTGEYVRLALPKRWTGLLGKWLFYGLLGAALSVFALLAVLVALPSVSELVYGQVSVIDSSGRRLLWTVPTYAFFAAGAGVGVGAVLRSPAVAVGVVLFWAFVIETAAGYLPSGAALQRFMPGLNAMFATGQDIVLTPPWNQNIALGYVCVLFTTVFVIAATERER